MKGLVFAINRFAIHDGQGIRTTVFFKGCPLRCVWCQNPEGLTLEKKLWYFNNRCLHCNQCVAACPQGALTAEGAGDTHRIVIDYALCDNCGLCTEVCPTNALAFDSEYYTVDQLLEEVLKDKVFYETSGGGVTISGGDPVFQPEFITEFLKACKANGIDTTMESSMYTSKHVIDMVRPYVDHFIVDIKLFDPIKHVEGVGQSNELILSNIQYLAQSEVDLLIRVPMIPGFTANKENLAQIGRFVSSLEGDVKIELLNHNHLARDKYDKMGITYPVDGSFMQYSEAEMNQFYSFLTM